MVLIKKIIAALTIIMLLTALTVFLFKVEIEPTPYEQALEEQQAWATTTLGEL